MAQEQGLDIQLVAGNATELRSASATLVANIFPLNRFGNCALIQFEYGIDSTNLDQHSDLFQLCWNKIQPVFSRVEGDLKAGSDTGGIVLSEFRGRLDLRSDTGSLEGRSVVLTADCQLATDTGSIDFELERSLEGLAFELASDTGLLWVGSAKGRKRLALGGGPLKVRARSDTGSISFR